MALKKTITNDNSITFLNEEYGEHYHSLSGAEDEAIRKHAEAARIAEFAKHGSLKVLDVCFGLGYNSAAAIDLALKENPDCMIEVVGLENDSQILQEILDISSKFTSYGLIKETVKNNFEYEGKNIRIRMLVADAGESVRSLTDEFDVVFHDPFSPKKCPELWTEEFFKELRKHVSKQGVLTTYSCARLVRENLKKAGFVVSDGPCVGRRAPSTIAKPS